MNTTVYTVMKDRRALKEAIVDTGLATPINLVLNYIFLAPMLVWEWSAGQISVAMTAIFFVVAVFRKYYVRQYFKRKEQK